VRFPADFQAPASFVALGLDEDLLAALLAAAPPEAFGRVAAASGITLPHPDGGFAPVSVAESLLMERELAERFPELHTYVFAGGASGHLVMTPSGAHAAAQTGAGLWWVEPVETADGRVYLSYFDAERRDGANVIIHDPHMGDHGDPTTPPVPPVPAALSAAAAPTPAVAALEAGSQLRIYRLAASTTGQFYQARDNGGGLLDVIASLLVDLAGANAVFEPEVSVRLVLAAASLDVIYDEPFGDPFNNFDSACDLRDDNRDNMKAELDDDDYDLGFLFASRSGGGANGCAWFVVCLTTNNTLHKARGAGKMGNDGANSASGLLAHEVGHQLGARHTFSGEDGACSENEFLAGDSESGYEPGSGTTRMSYNGNCDDDNVDVSPPVPAGSYFHSRSFDEIVGNVFFGSGATCGSLVATANQPPTVDAGADYTIPQRTPFTLTGSGADDQPLTFNWEQYDRAVEQRPIDTDPGDGPIIRSIPPDTDPTRTVRRLENLLDGTQRAGEILPQDDRELNFRLIARDNQMGGGGVAYDAMRITVDGPPFFITAPNSGVLEAACQEPLTWVVGGGSVAAQVEALFDDGPHTFTTPLIGPVANDGADSFTVPCALGAEGRIKLQSVGNIFFDVNDQDLEVVNTPPSVEVSASGGVVDDECEFLVEFSASASDPCGLTPGDVEVDLVKAEDNFTLGAPNLAFQQVSDTEVEVTGSAVISDLLASPAELSVVVTATDACGAATEGSAEAVVSDETPPEIDVTVDPDTLWPPNHKMRSVEAVVTATDNCPGVAFTLSAVTSDEPENGLGDGDTAPDVAGADLGTADLEVMLRCERAGLGDGRTYTLTYTAVDGSDNEAEASATVEVPKSRQP